LTTPRLPALLCHCCHNCCRSFCRSYCYF
jgi:hypothetical protein